MDYEIKETPIKRNCLCEFSIDTRIDDIDLANKIKAKFDALNISDIPNKNYVLEVTFDAAIYKDIAFYKFPVERKQWQIDNLNKLEVKKDSRKIAETIIGEVLSQQLNNICDIFKSSNITYTSAIIAGEDIDNTNRVDFCLYEDKTEIEENALKNGRKSKRTETKMVSHCIIPHRPSTVKKLAEVIAKMAIEHYEKEHQKEQEISLHTPNMKTADEIFTALSKAILEEDPNELVTPEALSCEMISQAKIDNDWPLKISGIVGVLEKQNPLALDSKIDCPEYLIFVKRKKHWTLEKATNRGDAKSTILNCGYNKKDVDLIVVLHNLKNMRFNLFADNHGEIEPICKREAHNAKKLLLSWCQTNS